MGEGKSNNPYIGAGQFIGGGFRAEDCVRFNRGRYPVKFSRFGTTREFPSSSSSPPRRSVVRMIGEFKIQRKGRGPDNAPPRFYSAPRAVIAFAEGRRAKIRARSARKV